MQQTEEEFEETLEEINILILGETGVGKSTWINAITNYIMFGNFDEAVENVDCMKALIPCKFSFRDKNGTHQIKFGEDDSNEILQVGKSATQGPKTYSLKLGNLKINLIDTPGIGDVGGIDADKKNFANILAYLSGFEKLHGVCILLKPNQSRLTVAFRFCVQELMSHLHKNLKKNMMFCFTHTRGTFYEPGDTFDLLQELLEKHNIDIPLRNGETYYCFDNEAFRLLACIYNGIDFEKKKMEAYSESWSYATETTMKMFQYIRDLQPHDIKNTVSMNEARNIVISLNKPMAEILQVVEKTRERCEEVKMQISAATTDLAEFNRNLHFKGFSLEIQNLDYPMTVCTHRDCVRYVPVGESRHQNTVYDTICHHHCYLTGIPKETTNNPDLIGCAAFGGCGNTCSCGHGYLIHMHITYKTTIVEMEFLSQVAQANIKSKGNLKSQKEDALKVLEKKIKDLEKERTVIMNNAAKFATFMSNTAMIPYNDSFKDYMDQLIYDEENKPSNIKDLRKIQKLKLDKVAYELQLETLKEAISSGTEDMIDVGDVYKLKEELMNLPQYGQNLSDILSNMIMK